MNTIRIWHLLIMALGFGIPAYSFGQTYGELSYDKLDFFQYRVYLRLVVPCSMENKPNASLNVVADNNPFVVTDSPEMTVDSAIKSFASNDPCIITPASCKVIYYMHADVHLTTASTITYFACCRDYKNLYITNGDPSSSTVCYILKIPSTLMNVDLRLPNKNAISADTVFNACLNKEFTYHLTTSDPDGDSVAYRLINPNHYTLKPDRAGNWTIVVHTPPYPAVPYTFPYTADHPLGKDVSFDPATGTLKGIMRDTGTFLLNVALDEYRNGVLITSHPKEIVVSVYDCSQLPKAKSSTDLVVNTCQDYLVQFNNNSNSHAAYFLWNFGDGEASSEFAPEHRYRDTGTYNLTLTMNKGYYCADSVKSKALIYPKVNAAFTYSDTCSDKDVLFTGAPTTTFGTITAQNWYFQNDSGGFDTVHNAGTVSHDFPKGDNTYLVKLEVANTYGCRAVDSAYVNIYSTPPGLPVHDTILSKGSRFTIPTLHTSTYDGATFAWTPFTGLDNISAQNPVVNYNNDITYHVTISSAFGCQRKDSIRIRYYVGPEVYVPSAFTPNNDGVNDVLRIHPVGIKSLLHFQVRDRWGNVIFETADSHKGWDGTFRGLQQPAGVYVWIATGIDANDRKVQRSGTITLLR